MKKEKLEIPEHQGVELEELTIALIQIMAELEKEFNLSDEKEFKFIVNGTNAAFREGILSKKLYRLTIFGLFCFKMSNTKQTL